MRAHSSDRSGVRCFFTGLFTVCLTLGALGGGIKAPGLSAQDCNQNGVADPEDIARGTSADCNRNGVPDECDHLFPAKDHNERD